MLFMDYGFGAPVKKAVAKSAPMVKRAAAVTKAPPPRPAPVRKPPAAKPAPKPAAAKPTADAGVTKLQHTLNSLAQRTGDSALTLKVDGLIGPRTAAATNRAMVKYGAVAGAPAEVRTGRLTPAQIKENASDLAYFVEKAVEKSLPKASPAVTKKVEAQKQAAVKRVAATRSDAIIALQRILRTLGVIVEDSALAIAIDGLIGPKTTAATNRALSRYAPSAPVMYKSGTLTQEAVVKAAPELTEILTEAAKEQQLAKRYAAAGRKPPAKKPPPGAPSARKGGDDEIPRVTIPAPYETDKPLPSEPEITTPTPQLPPQMVRPPVVPDAIYPPPAPSEPQLQPPGPTEAKKEIPWPWIIAGGAGLVGVVAVTVLIARKKKR